MWTHFMDMHSGGGQKLEWAHIYIEAGQSDAETIFYNRFGRNPNRVTCTCCGEDYSISGGETLEQASAFERGCRYDKEKKAYVEESGRDAWGDYTPLSEYKKRPGVKIIPASEVVDDERRGDIPEEGYVWSGG